MPRKYFVLAKLKDSGRKVTVSKEDTLEDATSLIYTESHQMEAENVKEWFVIHKGKTVVHLDENLNNIK
ncbi:MAG: hypothetical protein KKB31_02690 [Nanoarchaeota archaeon]|nr:hypothetical protein [Nanoarchaeota archaeon]